MISETLVTELLPHQAGLQIRALPDQTLCSLDASELTALFRRHGALCLRGFQGSTEEFVAFTEQFSSDFSGYEGGAVVAGPLARETVGGNQTLLTTTAAGKPFPVPLHGELYYFKNQPTVLWFYCAVAPLEKGETIVCDGRRVCEELSAETLQFFRDHRIRYIRELNAEQWQSIFRTNSLEEVERRCRADGATVLVENDGSICLEFVTSALRLVEGREVFINGIFPFYYTERAFLHGEKKTVDRLDGAKFPLIVRMEDGSPIPRARLGEVKKVTDALTAAIRWTAGDVLMINNKTHLHGRLEADGSPRLIYIRMGRELKST